MFGAHIAMAGDTIPCVAEAFTGDEPDIVDREDNNRRRSPDPCRRGESQRHRNADDGEYQTARR